MAWLREGKLWFDSTNFCNTFFIQQVYITCTALLIENTYEYSGDL